MTNLTSENDTGYRPQTGQWLPETTAAAPMDAHRIVKVSGPDAAALLQGQLSNDIALLDENPGQLSSFNSPKGRVLAFLRVLKQRDDYWLVVDAAIIDAVVQRLKMFVLRSKVTIETAGDLQGIAVTGARLQETFNGCGLPAPEAGHAMMQDGCVFLGLPGPVPRIEIYGAAGSLPSLEVDNATSDDLARWDIIFRLPRIIDANRDAHVAQHLDLDTLGAINFRKGCYTGQEIIARMKYLGKVKKRSRVFLGGDASPGDSIRTGDGRSAGDVVNVALTQGGQLVLAVVNHDDHDGVLTVNGRPLEPLR